MSQHLGRSASGHGPLVCQAQHMRLYISTKIVIAADQPPATYGWDVRPSYFAQACRHTCNPCNIHATCMLHGSSIHAAHMQRTYCTHAAYTQPQVTKEQPQATKEKGAEIFNDRRIFFFTSSWCVCFEIMHPNSRQMVL